MSERALQEQTLWALVALTNELRHLNELLELSHQERWLSLREIPTRNGARGPILVWFGGTPQAWRNDTAMSQRVIIIAVSASCMATPCHGHSTIRMRGDAIPKARANAPIRGDARAHEE